MRAPIIVALCVASIAFPAYADEADIKDVALCSTIQSGRWIERELGGFESCLQLTLSQVSAERVRFGRWGDILIAYDGSGFLISSDDGKRWKLLKSLDLQPKGDGQVATPPVQSDEGHSSQAEAPPPQEDGFGLGLAEDVDVEPALPPPSESVAELPRVDASEVQEDSSVEQPLENTYDDAPNLIPSSDAIPLAEPTAREAVVEPAIASEEGGAATESPPPHQDSSAPDEGDAPQLTLAPESSSTDSIDVTDDPTTNSALEPDSTAREQSSQGERPEALTIETSNICRIKSSDRWIQSNAPSLLICAKLLDQSPEIYDQQGLKYAYWRDQLLVATKYEIYVVDHESQRTSLLKRHRY